MTLEVDEDACCFFLLSGIQFVSKPLIGQEIGVQPIKWTVSNTIWQWLSLSVTQATADWERENVTPPAACGSLGGWSPSRIGFFLPFEKIISILIEKVTSWFASAPQLSFFKSSENKKIGSTRDVQWIQFFKPHD